MGWKSAGLWRKRAAGDFWTCVERLWGGNSMVGLMRFLSKMKEINVRGFTLETRLRSRYGCAALVIVKCLIPL